MDFAGVGTTADHAYWLSDIALRAGGGAAPLGTVDARSEAFGTGDPKPGATQTGAGSLAGGNLGSIGYTSQSKAWGGAPATRRADALDMSARNVRTVTVHPRRAKLSCDAALRVKTDGPVTVTLAGCDRSETFQKGGASGCAAAVGFRSASARPRGRRLRVRFARRTSRPVTVDVSRNSRGRRVLGNRRVAHFAKRRRSFTWKARHAGSGIYTVRLRSGGDVRRFVLARRGGRFHRRKAAARRPGCGLVRSFKLGLPVFGGTRGKKLALSYPLGSARTTRVTLLRGKRVVQRFKAHSRRAGRSYRRRIAPRKLRRGTYRVRLTLTRRGAKTRRVTLAALRL